MPEVDTQRLRELIAEAGLPRGAFETLARARSAEREIALALPALLDRLEAQDAEIASLRAVAHWSAREREARVYARRCSDEESAGAENDRFKCVQNLVAAILAHESAYGPLAEESEG